MRGREDASARSESCGFFGLLLCRSWSASAQVGGNEYDEAAAELAKRYLQEGRETFRFDTFGS